MPLQQTSGAASYDAFGGGVPVVPKYIEDAFSCFLYSGTSANQIITNGINLSTDGGLVWIKRRSSVTAHALFDTNRGVQKYLQSNTTDAEGTASTSLTAFFTDGFRVGADSLVNEAGETYVSWTLKKQPKFFDVVTYTGNGGTQSIAHNLGSVPGCIIVKPVSAAGAWPVYHRSINIDYPSYLNTTAAATGPNTIFGIAPTSTQFYVWTSNETNQSGVQYVAYLFAHNAGGFGLTGTDNVISCGSLTSSGSGGATVTLNYEAQWILLKNTSAAENWIIVDTMRGMSFSSTPFLKPNLSDAEGSLGAGAIVPTATGFTVANGVLSNSNTYIYIAIRRGPMKVPTSGTSVFSPIQAAGSTGTKLTTNFPVDLQIWALPGDGGSSKVATDRLRGVSTNTTTSGVSLYTDLTDAENNASSATRYFDNTGYTIPGNFLGSGYNAIYWNFRRAPSFFDEVCYTGNATSGATQTHNLGVVPEMMIVKNRSAAGYDWFVYHKNLTSAAYYLNLNSTAAESQYWNAWNSTQPTSSVFTIGNYSAVNASGNTYVAYLFATCAGVSKVGSYTGTGTTLQVDCGFAAGARFVLIKRTDSTGDWYVWDTARGIVSGNDPYLLLNSTAAETTSTDYIDTYSAGFEISSTAPAAINASGGTFIFLAIA